MSYGVDGQISGTYDALLRRMSYILGSSKRREGQFHTTSPLVTISLYCMTPQTSKTSPMNKKNILTQEEMNEKRQFDGLFCSLNQIKQMSEGIETLLDNSENLISQEVYTNISRLIGSLDAHYDSIVDPIEDENPIEDVSPKEVTNHLIQLQIESPEPMKSIDVGYEVFDRLQMLLEDEGSDFWYTVHEADCTAHTPTKEDLLERDRIEKVKQEEEKKMEELFEKCRQQARERLED